MKIKTNDTVIAITGRDKGKSGKVLSADPSGNKVIVQGIQVARRHVKPRKQGEEGGIIQQETPIYANKVMLVCPSCKKPTRVGYKLTEGTGRNGNKTMIKQRTCKKCGASFN